MTLQEPIFQIMDEAFHHQLPTGVHAGHSYFLQMGILLGIRTKHLPTLASELLRVGNQLNNINASQAS
ncbi:MAG: hypothetical protein U0520_03320 [Candidatus Saccharimonadales bacterium]